MPDAVHSDSYAHSLIDSSRQIHEFIMDLMSLRRKCTQRSQAICPGSHRGYQGEPRRRAKAFHFQTTKLTTRLILQTKFNNGCLLTKSAFHLPPSSPTGSVGISVFKSKGRSLGVKVVLRPGLQVGIMGGRCFKI